MKGIRLIGTRTRPGVVTCLGNGSDDHRKAGLQGQIVHVELFQHGSLDKDHPA